jgi:Uri superfamily endonuclease
MNGEIYESINLEHTLYTIYLKLDCDQSIKIGKLGDCFFKNGTYIYVGSACQKNTTP